MIKTERALGRYGDSYMEKARFKKERFAERLHVPFEGGSFSVLRGYDDCFLQLCMETV